MSALSLSLSVCLSPPSLLPPSGCFCGLFSCRCHSDCDADIPNRLPVCLDMSSLCVYVCVRVIKRQSALGLERKCFENYVMSSFLKGGQTSRRRKKRPICPHLCCRLLYFSLKRRVWCISAMEVVLFVSTCR